MKDIKPEMVSVSAVVTRSFSWQGRMYYAGDTVYGIAANYLVSKGVARLLT